MEKVINDAHQHAKVARSYAKCVHNIKDLANARGDMAERLSIEASVRAWEYVKIADELCDKYDLAKTADEKSQLTDQAHDASKACHKLLNRVIGHVVGNYEARKREEYVAEQDDMWKEHEATKGM